MTMIDIKPEIIDDLREILLILEETAQAHHGLADNEELIEPWTPSDQSDQVYSERLTVGLTRKAERVRKALRL